MIEQPPDPLEHVAGRKLNLGCAQYPLASYVNVDWSIRTAADTLCHLDRHPYPFRTASFDAIVASHIFEHLNDVFSAMRECHRLLRPGGTLLVKVPHFSRGFTHPEHKRGFDVSFPLFFDPAMMPWYVGMPFVLERMRLHWAVQNYLKRWVTPWWVASSAAAVGHVIDTVANLSPMLFSRVFGFLVGGFEEIEFRFRRGEDGLV